MGLSCPSLNKEMLLIFRLSPRVLRSERGQAGLGVGDTRGLSELELTSGRSRVLAPPQVAYSLGGWRQESKGSH